MIALYSANTFQHLFKLRLDILKKLKNDGNMVYTIAENDKYRCKIEELGIKTIAVKVNSKNKNVFQDFLLILKYVKIFNRIKPDIIFNSTIKPNIYGSMASNFLKIKTINNVSGLGTSFLKSKMLEYLVINLYKISQRNVFKIFFQNQTDFEFFLKNKICDENQAELIPGSGINTRKFKRNTVFRPNEFKKFLFVGRLINEKGVNELLSAAEKFLVNNNGHFTFVGDYDSQNPSSVNIKEFKNRINSFKNIEYLGYKEDIKNLIQESDCLILPSYREGLSNVILEALSMEIPVLASNVPGCNDLIIDEFNGLLFEPRNFEDLFHKISKFSELSDSKIINMGINGRKFVVDKYDLDILFKHYESVLQ